MGFPSRSHQPAASRSALRRRPSRSRATLPSTFGRSLTPPFTWRHCTPPAFLGPTRAPTSSWLVPADTLPVPLHRAEARCPWFAAVRTAVCATCRPPKRCQVEGASSPGCPVVVPPFGDSVPAACVSTRLARPCRRRPPGRNPVPRRPVPPAGVSRRGRPRSALRGHSPAARPKSYAQPPAPSSTFSTRLTSAARAPRTCIVLPMCATVCCSPR